jgi:glyoxylase-like metal-dependent hydrolase (beta-lactamase superfamily II)
MMISTRGVSAVAVPGHTPGSMGYFAPTLSFDAVAHSVMTVK